MARTKRLSKVRKGSIRGKGKRVRRVQSKRVGKKRTKRSSNKSSNKRMRRSFIKKSRGRPRRSQRRMRGGSYDFDSGERVYPPGDTEPWSNERQRRAGEVYEERYGTEEIGRMEREIRDLTFTLQRRLEEQEESYQSKLRWASSDEEAAGIAQENERKITEIKRKYEMEKPSIDAEISRKKGELDAFKATKDVDPSVADWD